MANIARGEVDIELDGVEYLMRPDFNAMQEFEDKSGTTATDVISEYRGNPITGSKGTTPGFKVCAAAIWSGIRSGFPEVVKHQAPTYQEIGKILFEKGITNYIGAVIQYLIFSTTAKDDLKKLADKTQAELLGEQKEQQATDKTETA